MRAAKLVGLAALLLAGPVRANPFHFPLQPQGKRLVDRAGHPFLFLADTATSLFVRLGRDEALEYLRDRRIRGFTAVTAALATGAPDAAGAPPFEAGDLGRPGAAYFEHAEQIIRSAEALGLLLALDPGPLDGKGAAPVRAFGHWLGSRFGRYANIVWTADLSRAEGRAFAAGLAETSGQLVQPPLAARAFEGEPGGPSPKQVRRDAYQALLESGRHVYGSAVRAFGPDWRTRLELPGGASLAAARRLFDSRPWQTLAPDQSLLRGRAGEARAGRAADGSFALVYLPAPHPVSVDTRRISGQRVRAWWFDPRTGQTRPAALAATTGTVPLVPPARGSDEDWVLVLDDGARGFRPPGSEPPP
jgi:hypothetical protein